MPNGLPDADVEADKGLGKRGMEALVGVLASRMSSLAGDTGWTGEAPDLGEPEGVQEDPTARIAMECEWPRDRMPASASAWWDIVPDGDETNEEALEDIGVLD